MWESILKGLEIAGVALLVLGVLWFNFCSRHRIRESIGFMCTGCSWTGSNPALEFTQWLTLRAKRCPKCGKKVIPF
jgi:hypothetical protein